MPESCTMYIGLAIIKHLYVLTMCMYVGLAITFVRTYDVHVGIVLARRQVNIQPCTMCTYVGLARTIYIHRIWPYISWFLCQNNLIYTVYIWFWQTGFGKPYGRRIRHSLTFFELHQALGHIWWAVMRWSWMSCKFRVDAQQHVHMHCMHAQQHVHMHCMHAQQHVHMHMHSSLQRQVGVNDMQCRWGWPKPYIHAYVRCIYGILTGNLPEGANWGPTRASFYMLFDLNAPKLASSKFLNNMNTCSVHRCKIWSLPILGRVLNLLWRAGHF